MNIWSLISADLGFDIYTLNKVSVFGEPKMVLQWHCCEEPFQAPYF